MIRPIRRLAKGALTGAALAAVMLAASLSLTASPAAAHTKLDPSPSCAGGQVGHYHRFGGDVTIFIDFTNAGGGTNCAWAQKQTSRGTEQFMNISIRRCATGNPNAACNATALDQDPGDWEYYAGPVRVDNAAGKCIMVRVFYRGSWSSFIGPAHCG